MSDMKLMTTVDIKRSAWQINYNDRLLLLGSCFSDEIAGKLREYYFNVDDVISSTVFNMQTATVAHNSTTTQAEFQEAYVAKDNCEVTLGGVRTSFTKGTSISKAEYDQIVKNAAGKNKEYNTRHILVKTEDEAKEVIAALKKGEKFEDLAKAKSQDPGTKDNGGELGWSTPRTFVKPFADAMVGLKKGETSPEPVKTDFGYHVIQVKDVRDATPPAFNDVKAQVEERLQQKRVADFVQGIESKAEVK